MELSKIHRGKGMKSKWYVSYKVPGKVKPIQVRGGINRGKTISEREEIARVVKDEIDADLLKKQEERPKKFMSIKQGVDWAFNLRKGAWRGSTLIVMQSKLNVFYKAIDPDSNILDFGTEQAMEALNNVSFKRKIKDRNLGARAYKDFKQYIGSFFADLKYAKKIRENPFDFKARIKTPPADKTEPLTTIQIHDIKNYLSKADHLFLRYIAVYYYTVMRPSEVFQIQIEDIHLDAERPYIKAYKDRVKDKESRIVWIPDNLMPWLQAVELNKYPGDWYLFGKNYAPEKRERPLSYKYTRTSWSIVCRELSIKNKFYAWKHTAIDVLEDMMPGAGTQQAGHSDAYMTRKHYRSKGTKAVVDVIKNMPEF